MSDKRYRESAFQLLEKRNIGVVADMLEELDTVRRERSQLRSQLAEAHKALFDLKADEVHWHAQLAGTKAQLAECQREVAKWRDNYQVALDNAVECHQETQQQRQRAEQAEKLLHDLTPMGSEFVGNPQRCVEWVKQEIADNIRLTVEATAARRQAETERDETQAVLGIEREYRIKVEAQLAELQARHGIDYDRLFDATCDELRETKAQLAAVQAHLAQMRTALEIAKGHIVKLEVDYLQCEPDVAYIDAVLALPAGRAAVERMARMEAVVEAAREWRKWRGYWFAEWLRGETPSDTEATRQQIAKLNKAMDDALAALDSAEEVKEQA